MERANLASLCAVAGQRESNPRFWFEKPLFVRELSSQFLRKNLVNYRTSLSKNTLDYGCASPKDNAVTPDPQPPIAGQLALQRLNVSAPRGQGANGQTQLVPRLRRQAAQKLRHLH